MPTVRLKGRSSASSSPLLLLAQCLVLLMTEQLHASAALSSPVGSLRIRHARVSPLRLRGGFFGIGSKPTENHEGEHTTHLPEDGDANASAAFWETLSEASVVSKEQMVEWMVRSTSYSVLDQTQITEPGVANYTDDNAQQQEEYKVTNIDLEQGVADVEDRVKAALDAVEAAQEKWFCAPSSTKRTSLTCELVGWRAGEPFKRLNIVMVSSELARYAKSGGLADVADKLSIALAKRGHRVMTVMPMYGYYEGVIGTGVRRGFGIMGGGHTVEYWHKWDPHGPDPHNSSMEAGVDQIFVDHPCFHRPGMYGEWGKDYEDNLFRFALFAWASLEAPLCLPTIAPFGQDVVFIANDWQCGLVPLIL
ncbi:hypothetical protein GUITHDRAFT_149615, partial [Guillardia theta CCMP2712]